jgi:hypothetical protein
MTDLLLQRASESRPGADGRDDYDVIGADGLVIGRIFKANRAALAMDAHLQRRSLTDAWLRAHA